MKVIDLLKLIQEGKQPKEVIYKGKKYIWCKDMGDYRRDGCYECLLMTKIFEYDEHMHNSLYNMIYDEVEIIEDKHKKIERLNFNKDWKHGLCLTYQYRLVDTLNEIIKELNYLLEKSDSND